MLPARFWAKVNKDGPLPANRPELGPCWAWTAFCDDGYGRFKWRGTTVFAHRAAWINANGEPSAESPELDHLCRNPACCNPAHLEAVTHAENMARSAPAQKTHCVNGHPFDVANTYIRPSGGGARDCRRCTVERQRRYRLRLAEAA